MANRPTKRHGLRLAGGILSAAAAALGSLGVASSARADGGGSSQVTVTVPAHSTPPLTLTCTGAGGKALGDNPTLHPKDQLSCSGGGFGPGEKVTASLSATRTVGIVTAGGTGSVALDFSLPSDLGAGRQTLKFAGAATGRSATFPFTVTIVATLPVGGGGSNTSGGGGGGGDNGGGSTDNPGGGSLAKTGMDAFAVAGGGLVLVAFGVVARVVGRRRREPGATGREDG
jgi:hypothetical protein